MYERDGEGVRKRDRGGHRYTVIGSESKQAGGEKKTEGGGGEEAQKGTRGERTEAEERRKIGREKSVYSGKCMRER